VSDLDERAWWVFRLPEAVAYVPAGSEEQARAVLASTCYPATKRYPAAPVHEWPLTRTRVCSSAALTKGVAKP
jgi:hypothetical protein